jgi:hypothetical protein
VTRRRWLPLVFVVVAALAYACAALATGAPRFPSPRECVRTATRDGDLEAVFGRFTGVGDAQALLQRVVKAGFVGSAVEPDGCGRWKVDVHGVKTLDVGRQLAAEARTVGLKVTIERVNP